ncbi:MFS transporter [Alteromonas aestuariivivens]|uniref:MFS transporter n=1 Tax=Alteromonas aestuariivivens TaxID=1938339 RepID=A0A3D8M7B5_9ALTE|nr:MFS transporter [Alteromonas aestuariivivens]RDV25540.1 MFS transporter [Alteromonas aestuariivivens]
MNAIEVRAALALALVYVLRMLGLFMVMPVLALSAMEYPDYSPLMVGLAIGGYGLTQATLQIPMGMLSDKWGRKPVILLGLSVFALGSFIAAQADSMVWMVVGRILQGAGAIAGAIMALATDVSRESQRAKVMAIIGIAIGFSFYIAVLLGPILAEQWGLAGIFAITGILALLCMPLVQWAVPSVKGLASGDTLPDIALVGELILSSQLWRLNVSVMLLHMMITLLFVQLPVTLMHFNMSLESHWMLYLPVLAASVAGLVVMMAMARGRVPKSLLNSAIVMMAIAFALLATQGETRWVVVTAVILFFTGFNYLEASFPALVSSIAPAGRKGTAMGIYASFQFFGAFLGGLLSGLVTDLWSADRAYLLGAAGASVWLILFMGFREVARIKRIQMNASFSEQQEPELREKLCVLPGVQDTEFSSQNNTIYLKVTAEFDQRLARNVVEEIHP